jgi:hypothetical protein
MQGVQPFGRDSQMMRVVGGAVLVVGIGLAVGACGARSTPVGAPPASTVATTTTAATQPVYVEFDPTPAAQKPAELDIYNHTELTGINWSSWGEGTAQGTGVLADNTCTPDCAAGHDNKFDATVKLTDIQQVNGKQEYTRYTVTFPEQGKYPDLAKALTDQPTNPAH